MAITRTGSRFHRGHGARKGTDWSASAVQLTFVTLGAQSASLLEIFVPIAGGETLVRVRGRIAYGTDQEAVDEVYLGAFGMAVVSEQAASVGITAVPHPATDAAWDGWLYHTYLQGQVRVIGTAGNADFNAVQTIEIDSKAMRKVGEDDRLVVVAENMGSAGGMIIANSERLLSKLH